MVAVTRASISSLGELLGQVVGDHRGLGALLGGLLVAAGVGERLGGLAALLGLAGEHAEHVVVGELARLLAGDLGVGDRGQHHPQRRGAQLVARLDRRWSGRCAVGPSASLMSAIVAACAAWSLAAGLSPAACARSGRPSGRVPRRARARWRTPPGSRSATSSCAASRCRCCPPGTGRCEVLHVSDLHLTPDAGPKRRWLRLARRPRARPGGQHRRQPRPPGRRSRRCVDGARPAARRARACSCSAPTTTSRRRCATRCATSSPTTASATPAPPSCRGSDLRAAFDDARLGRPDQHARAARRSAAPRIAFAGVDDPHLELRRPRRGRRPGARPTPTCGSASRTRRTCGCSTSSPATATTLIFAGHTHGGQVCLPVKGALVTNCDLDTGARQGPAPAPGRLASRRPGLVLAARLGRRWAPRRTPRSGSAAARRRPC